MNKIRRVVLVYLFARKQAKREAQNQLFTSVCRELVCDNVSVMPTFFMGISDGTYDARNEAIAISTNVFGIRLIDNMFHEDRHHAQHMRGLLHKKPYIRCTSRETYVKYLTQWVEYDARRYAYVMTIKYLRDNPGLIPKWKVYIYKAMYHPFLGRIHKSIKKQSII